MPRTVRTGRVLRVAVTVTGTNRLVRLERHLHGAWRVVDRARSGATGTTVLAWRAPITAKRVVLRIRVVRTDRHRAARTVGRTVVVRAAPVAAPTPSAPTSTDDALRAELLRLVNEARASARTCGTTAYPSVAPLGRSAALDTAAGGWATRMATEDLFAHASPDGSTMVSRLRAVGISNTTERENIAAGQSSAASVMASWLGSPGHCANLMAADVTRIGFGHAVRTGSAYGTYWVQDLAGAAG